MHLTVNSNSAPQIILEWSWKRHGIVDTELECLETVADANR